ncbi:MAG TPA: DinB family protein [Planctomycetaceae bacterium]|nr:DinB family protein [Planctomycetaceae bacterium]
MTPLDPLDLVRRQIEAARAYTLTLLDGLEPEDWFRIPPGCVSHVAWQVGHLAMAQYGLALFRQRGRLPVDLELMPGSFRKTFSKGTTPNADPSAYPSVDEIRQIFDRVHRQVLDELPTFDRIALTEKVDPPHFAFDDRFGALVFASHHEMLHAGQIGLLRRLLGRDPVR